MEETIALEKQLHVTTPKWQTNTQNVDTYTLVHSASILWVNLAAKIQLYFTYPQARTFSEDYQSILIKLGENKYKPYE